MSPVSNSDKQRIFDYLQGSVHCWCKNKPEEPFSLRDLVGGANFSWEDTPLQVLYEKHKTKGHSHKMAIKVAGQNAGRILSNVIEKDRRNIETQEGFVNQYKLQRESTEV